MHPHPSRRQRVAFLFSYRSEEFCWPAIHSSEPCESSPPSQKPMEVILRPDPPCVGSERRMVGSAGNAPVVASGLFEDTGFTDRQPDHFPKILRPGLPSIAPSLKTSPPSQSLWRASFAPTRPKVSSERRMVAGVGVAPTEAEFMRLA